MKFNLIFLIFITLFSITFQANCEKIRNYCKDQCHRRARLFWINECCKNCDKEYVQCKKKLEPKN